MSIVSYIEYEDIVELFRGKVIVPAINLSERDLEEYTYVLTEPKNGSTVMIMDIIKRDVHIRFEFTWLQFDGVVINFFQGSQLRFPSVLTKTKKQIREDKINEIIS